MGFEMNLYTMQEFLGVLLVLAALTGTILVFAIVFILFQEGRRRAVCWAKTGLIVQRLSARYQWLQRAHGRSALR